MTGLSIVGVTGSPAGTSTTHRLVMLAVDRIARETGAETRIIEVAKTGALATQSRAGAGRELEESLRAAETADLLVVGSPVYKGSYSGIFKHFVDLMEPRALVGTPVALLATGGSDRHALVIEHQFRPLFAFFQAQVLGTGLFLTSSDFVDGRMANEPCAQRFERLVSEAVAALSTRRESSVAISAAA